MADLFNSAFSPVEVRVQRGEEFEFEIDVVEPQHEVAKGKVTVENRPHININVLSATLTHRRSLKTWLKMCKFHEVPGGLTPDRLKPFMTHPFPETESDVETLSSSGHLIVFELNRDMTRQEIIDYRFTTIRSFAVNFDQMLEAYLENPEFFTDKEVLNVDVLLCDDHGLGSITKLVTSRTGMMHHSREIRLVDPDHVFPKGTLVFGSTMLNPAVKVLEQVPEPEKKRSKPLIKKLLLSFHLKQAFQPAAEGGA